MRKIRAIIATLLATASAIIAAPAPRPITIDSQAAIAPGIEVYRANEVTFRVTYKDGGAIAPIGANVPVMWWATSNTAASVVTASYSIVSATTGIVDFTFAPASLNYAAGEYVYGVGFRQLPRTYRQGAFKITGDSFASGAGAVTFGTNLNWGLISAYSGTASYGPYRIGSGIATATNADGSLTLTVSGSGLGDMLASVYDPANQQRGVVFTNDARLTDSRVPLAHTQDVGTVTGAITAGALADATNAVAVDVMGKVPSTNGLESVAAAIVRTNMLAQDIVAKIPSMSGLVSNGAVTIAAGANVTVNGGASAVVTNGATITIASSGGGGGTGDYVSVGALLNESNRIDSLPALSDVQIYVTQSLDLYTNHQDRTDNPHQTTLAQANAAQGYAGVALGTNTVASGEQGATALGYDTVASGIAGATAIGHGSIASGNNGSIAIGYDARSSGSFGAIALGSISRASNSSAFVWSSGYAGISYGDHGNGTFNINTFDGLSGVWINETNLPTHISAVSRETLLPLIQSNELSSVSHDFMQDIRLALIDNRDIYNADEGPVVTFATSMGGINLAESTNYFYSASAKYCANYVTNGNCVRMDRTNDYIQLSGDIGNYTNNFSVSMWVRLHSTATSQQLISRGAWGAGAHSQWLIHWASNDRLYFGTNSGGGAYVTSSGLNNTNWHHIAWTINGQSTNQAIYIDGVRKAVGGTTTPVEMSITSAAPVVIGAARFGTTNLSPAGAFFDEVLIWNREITSNEQYALYNGGIGKYTYTNDAVASNLVAMYHLDDNGTSTNAIDSGPLQWPAATLNNGPTWAAGERANKDEAVSMRLTLTNYAAQTTLDNGFAMVAVEPINSINSAADLNLYVSRDGGTSSNKVTLTHDGKWDSGTRGIFVGSFDASTQPAGTNWVLRYVTSTNRMNTYGLGIQLK